MTLDGVECARTADIKYKNQLIYDASFNTFEN
jgi:hypothetical protein